MSVYTIVDRGFDGLVAEIECRITRGLPSVIIVGFASKAVDEAKERIRSAFSSLPVDFPRQRITINLAPADIPKQHTSFDLAIAVSILETVQAITAVPESCAFFGELGLQGTLRPVRGLIGKLLAAKQHGITTVYIPTANAEQAALVSGLQIIPCRSLYETYELLTGANPPEPLRAKPATPSTAVVEHSFADISGQDKAKRVLTIAIAGRHNILLQGPPGTGKSMLAKAAVSLLPPMSRSEMLETTHIHSLHGTNYEAAVTQRPFRSPHHSASETAIIGGGQSLRPGEISLAHNGVLFFDELPEFKRNVIEALRQPLEDHVITLSRTKDSVQFPAQFVLIATANPCPCGFFGTSQPCQCQGFERSRYLRKLSGPILDRIDLYVEVDHIEHPTLLAKTKQSQYSQIRTQIMAAIDRQWQRYGAPRYNSAMTNAEIKQLAQLTAAARRILDQGAARLGLSPRAYMRTIKVARTIADLEVSQAVTEAHITEALQYRRVTPDG